MLPDDRKMKADVILGLQWGDEGKGKIVDLLTPRYDIVARFQGGPNAGHTLKIGGDKHILHLIPSGIFHPGVRNLIGNGVIIDPVIMKRELDGLKAKGISPGERLLVSRRAHLILPSHRLLDACFESSRKDDKIGSTLKGIGPAYTDKTGRTGIRAGEIFTPGFRERVEKLKAYHLRMAAQLPADPAGVRIEGLSLADYEESWFAAIGALRELSFVDGEIYLNQALEQGKRVLAEGAQGTLLDVDFGSYPFVTSSNTTIGGVCTGLGLPPSRIGKVFGVFKAYCTRVGNGPFPTELFDDTGQQLRDKGQEYGSTTGRPRRCGWLDLPALRYAVLINGIDELIMMKADVLSEFDKIRVCTSYRLDNRSVDLPEGLAGSPEPVYSILEGWKSDISQLSSQQTLPGAFTDYVSFIESAAGAPVTVVSLGPERNQTILLHE